MHEGHATTAHPPNALAGESSPYLLQHAFNPVAWRPWGPEAIEAARVSDRPLFVSIGYATCYWCHVMERESFENETTAELLNRAFVPVKVDREERPDVDDVYMAACRTYTQLTEGRASGGWPLSVFVDPATLAPFYVGTYFPPEPLYGRPSFRQLLAALDAAWRTRRNEVRAQGARLAALVGEELTLAAAPQPLPTHLVDAAVEALLRASDPVNGGFGGAPKFPQPVYLELLATRSSDPRVAAALTLALDRMALGGIFDHLAGGFHRYAVDATWSVPHFEKMLYDNAQLATHYARSAARTGDAFHAEVARRTCDWVLAEMTEPDGTFRSALDAEVDAKEGGSYLWNRAEVAEALTAAGLTDDIDFANDLFGLANGPNFRDPHDPSAPPTNVLLLAARPEVLAARRGMTLAEFDAKRSAVMAALLRARRTRRQPALDDKVLAGWNGLMIAALAECGRLLQDTRYIAAAVRAADAIERRLRGSDRRLHRTSRLASQEGAPRIHAYLEDYVFLCAGRLSLHAATGRPEDLLAACALHAEALARHRDPRGGCFDVAEGESELFVRARSLSDGAVPSGNGYHLLNTVALLAATNATMEHDRFRDEAVRSFAGLSGTLVERPIDCAISIVALDRLAAVAPEVHARLADRGSVAADSEPEPVRARASFEGDSQGALHLEIDEPWHLDVHHGLSIALLGRGALVLNVPPGEPWRDDFVHRGAVRIGFSIEGLGGSLDEPVLDLLVRPCDESRCLPARRLFVRVERPERASQGA